MSALSHLRVLDLSRVLAGPWSTQILGDLGAEVIKVERPEVGDDTRTWGPPFLRDGAGNATKESAYFQSCNRNKQSVTIDFTKAEGQELVRELARKSDIVVENFKVGGLQQYGLDYASLKPINPKLIYCSITGFGQTGPYRNRAGYDFMIQAMGGIMSITGEADGKPGGGPMKIGVALTDIMTGMYATVAILAALAHRERTGAGQYIDLALLDVQVAVLANQALNYLVSGKPPQRMGNAHPNVTPYQVFATRDGHMVLAIGNDAQFARFCACAGRGEVAQDTRFRTNAARIQHRTELMPIVAHACATRTTAEWIELLEQAGVPCGPINDLAQVFANEQVTARGMQVNLPHASGGSVPLVASPLRLSATPPEYQSAPPLLGQHTEAVLTRLLGLSSGRLEQLKASGVV
jgi:crotonobetainyl-CoA:carnitine CoA-transferase CaiB-like acyl-CoA transferase